MEPTAILSFGVSKLTPKPASLATHPATLGQKNHERKLILSPPMKICNTFPIHRESHCRANCSHCKSWWWDYRNTNKRTRL